MTLNDLLTEYEKLTSECRQLLETEISLCQNGSGGSNPEVLDRKKTLIGQLDGLLGQLRVIRETSEGSPVIDKSRINFLQQKFMQILRLDRELEKLLLKERNLPVDTSCGAIAPPGIAAKRYKQSEQSS